ncbi:MAG: ATP phosphoribosyltransferase regulatory subunit, partial [Parvularculaceae bacterium]|nr:ATP phosphoribosyltransferase regulatory subunit [Parvularculaceae bacterium]
LKGDAKMGLAIEREAHVALSGDLSDGKPARRPFHWPLEFPEIFLRTNGGFDSMLGNPPFMFGKNVTNNLGRSYNSYLINLNPDANKNVDLCAHFFVRVYDLISVGRCFAMLASSSISEGATGNASLGRICSIGGSIFRARTKIKWPGRAAVYVATVGIFKGRWHGERILDGYPVSEISPLLTDEEGWKLEPLGSNDGLAFVGVIPNGSGFFLCEDEYRSLIAIDDKYRDVLFPYITGEDINASTQRQRRYIINFWDWPMAKAQQYQDVFKIVEDRVKPHRATLSDVKKKAKEKWWLYEASAKNLLHAVGRSGLFVKKPKGQSRPLSRAIAIARISKTAAFTFIPTDAVYAAEVVVIANDDYGLFAVLQSSIHVAFAWNWAGKMGTDLRYSPTLCFVTFPFPPINEHLRTAGEKFYLGRQQLLESSALGLTDLYGRFHDPRDEDSDLCILRGLGREMDLKVIESYGWEDLSLEHGFHK